MSVPARALGLQEGYSQDGLFTLPSDRGLLSVFSATFNRFLSIFQENQTIHAVKEQWGPWCSFGLSRAFGRCGQVYVVHSRFRLVQQAVAELGWQESFVVQSRSLAVSLLQSRPVSAVAQASLCVGHFPQGSYSFGGMRNLFFSGASDHTEVHALLWPAAKFQSVPCRAKDISFDCACSDQSPEVMAECQGQRGSGGGGGVWLVSVCALPQVTVPREALAWILNDQVFCMSLLLSLS